MTENSGDGTGEALQNYPVITDFFKVYARIDSSGDKKDRERIVSQRFFSCLFFMMKNAKMRRESDRFCGDGNV